MVQEAERRGWHSKRWTTRKGQVRGGERLSKTNLYRLLTNPAYIGKVKYKTEVHEGEHEGIIDLGTWQKVQALLGRNGRTGGPAARNKFGALLKGLIHCTPCGCSMTPCHTTRNGTTRYRYYVCTRAQKRGWQSCPSKSLSAQSIEDLVVDQIRHIGQDPALLCETMAQTLEQGRQRLEALDLERRRLQKDLTAWHNDIRTVAQGLGSGDESATARLAE